MAAVRSHAFLAVFAALGVCSIFGSTRPVHAESDRGDGDAPIEHEGATREATRRRYVVAAIGDSLTDTRVGGGRYMAALAKRCPQSRFDAYGIGGQFTSDMRARFASDLFGAGKPEYTHVIVLGGVNDLLSGRVAVKSVASQLEAMYTTARARGLTTIALTVPPWAYPDPPRDRARTVELDRWILAQPVDRVVDITPLLECGPQKLLCEGYRRMSGDGTHWNERGHERVAAAIWDAAMRDCE